MAANVRLIITNMTYRGSARRMCILEEDRKIVEIRPESTENGAAPGDVYVGQVENAPGNLDAVFVRISPDERCYLPIKDTQNAVYSSGTGNRTKPKAGDELLVQVTRGKMKTKLAAVSAELSFPGRYLVLSTGREGLMFSKKLSANEKERLKGALEKLEIQAKPRTETDPGFGLLVRTEAVQATKEELLREYHSLSELYVSVAINGSHRTLYSRLYRPDADYIGMLKDLKEETAEAILTDDREVMEHISTWCKTNAPSLISKIKLYEVKLLPLPKLISLERTLDEALKKQFDALCADFGMNATTAFNIFARAVVRERRIPFEIASPKPEVTRESGLQAFLALREEAKQAGIQDMTLDEMNEEIRLARQEREGKG